MRLKKMIVVDKLYHMSVMVEHAAQIMQMNLDGICNIIRRVDIYILCRTGMKRIFSATTLDGATKGR